MIQKEFIETDAGPIARVTFILPSSMWADTIYLVGDFNGWNHSSHPFHHGRQDMWTITVDLELNRSYQFRYRRDGDHRPIIDDGARGVNNFTPGEHAARTAVTRRPSHPVGQLGRL